MKVIKFGGSSLANATQLRKVFNIVKSDEKRKIVVVSAPGKRTSDDEKVTHLLIQLATSHIEGNYDEEVLKKILVRYKEICDELELKREVFELVRVHFANLKVLHCEESFHFEIINPHFKLQTGRKTIIRADSMCQGGNGPFRIIYRLFKTTDLHRHFRVEICPPFRQL